MQLSSVPGNIFIRCFHWMFSGRIVKQKHPYSSPSLPISLYPNNIILYSRTFSNSDSRSDTLLVFSRYKLNGTHCHTQTIPTRQPRLSSNTSLPGLPLSLIPKLSITHDEGCPYSSKILFCYSTPWGPCISF
ncbi:hypothetical protein HJG60_012281 [Phyllostomus discolor]|uniref:Uncharacterized protein n=1 Tax=Phyllostomus discolor TaxID=89673 RepID=A0A833Z848_9CHIR|nr:hypothetical protein HJG60_012281 [Phyllostomus discolor]